MPTLQTRLEVVDDVANMCFVCYIIVAASSITILTIIRILRQRRTQPLPSSDCACLLLRSPGQRCPTPNLFNRFAVWIHSVFCSGTAAVRVPLQFRKEWIPLPRSLAQSSSNGHLALRLRVRSYSSPKSKVRVPVVRVIFPLAGGYMDGLRLYPKYSGPPPTPPTLLLLLIPPLLAGLVQAT
jgi:hypothetical protein